MISVLHPTHASVYDGPACTDVCRMVLPSQPVGPSRRLEENEVLQMHCFRALKLSRWANFRGIHAMGKYGSSSQQARRTTTRLSFNKSSRCQGGCPKTYLPPATNYKTRATDFCNSDRVASRCCILSQLITIICVARSIG